MAGDLLLTFDANTTKMDKRLDRSRRKIRQTGNEAARAGKKMDWGRTVTQGVPALGRFTSAVGIAGVASAAVLATWKKISEAQAAAADYMSGGARPLARLLALGETQEDRDRLRSQARGVQTATGMDAPAAAAFTHSAVSAGLGEGLTALAEVYNAGEGGEEFNAALGGLLAAEGLARPDGSFALEDIERTIGTMVTPARASSMDLTAFTQRVSEARKSLDNAETSLDETAALVGAIKGEAGAEVRTKLKAAARDIAKKGDPSLDFMANLDAESEKLRSGGKVAYRRMLAKYTAETVDLLSLYAAQSESVKALLAKMGDPSAGFQSLVAAGKEADVSAARGASAARQAKDLAYSDRYGQRELELRELRYLREARIAGDPSTGSALGAAQSVLNDFLLSITGVISSDGTISERLREERAASAGQPIAAPALSRGDSAAVDLLRSINTTLADSVQGKIGPRPMGGDAR